MHIEGARLGSLDVARMVYGNGRQPIPGQLQRLGSTRKDLGTPPQGWDAFAHEAPSRQATISMLDEFFSHALAISRMTRKERVKDPLDAKTFERSLPAGQLVGHLMIPNLALTFFVGDQNELEVAATRLMVALELFRSEHADYPDRLSELVPAYLPALPDDPFSSDGFRYRRLKEGETAPPGGDRLYLLYSIGADGRDDGGCTDPRGRAAALEPGGAGFDFVCNCTP
jgi:hypothetical protein